MNDMRTHTTQPQARGGQRKQSARRAAPAPAKSFADMADTFARHAEVILALVREPLGLVAQAVAAAFGLGTVEAKQLLKPRGPHRLGAAKGAVVLLALELLPIGRLTLAALMESSETLIYRCQAQARRRLKSDGDFASRVDQARAALAGKLNVPKRTRKPRKETGTP